MKAFSILLACVLLCGCGDSDTTWSTQLRSPDGKWEALASSEVGGGFGNAYQLTTVSIKQADIPRGQPVEVLVFDHAFDSRTLKMEWPSSTHFRVIYGEKDPRDNINVLFQAVRCFGSIEISLQYAGLAKVQDFN
jgi:hypothetical protein